MNRKSILLLVVLLCAWRVSGNQDTLYDDLEYSVQIPKTNCSDLNVCSDLNCKIIPKKIPFQVHMKRVIKDSDARVNWTCVEMETVDGLCQNGLMEKAVMRHKMVQRMRNSDVCHSVQPIELKMKNAVSNSFNFLQKSVNDQCKAIGGNKFECNVKQSYKFMVDYIIGGYSQQTELSAQLQKKLNIESDHHGSLNITSRLDDMYYSNASVQLENNTSIDIDETKLNVFDQLVTSKSGSILKDQVRGQLGDRFLNDSVEIIAPSELIQIRTGSQPNGMKADYQINGMKCSHNTLCSKSNCDRVYKSRREKREHTKWTGGAFWITNPPRGYSCYDKRFNGCYCRKTWYVDVSYPVDRSAICQQKVVTSLKVRNRADFTIRIDSLFNNCVYSQQNNGTCTANVNVVAMIDVQSGNNKDTIKAHISSTVSLVAIVEESHKFVWHMTITNQHLSFSSQLSNSLFVKTHPFFNQMRSEMDKQIISISMKKLDPVIKQLSDHEFTRNVQVSTHDVNSDDSDDDDIQPIVIGREECSSNALCSRNCELVPVNETYSVNLNKTVEEDNQDNHEEYGWNCTVTLNNVSRCANDLYWKRETRMRLIREEAHPDVCFSQVSPIVNLNKILVNQIHQLDLNTICDSSMNGTTQQLLCQDIPASATWNFNVTAGGNAQSYQVNSTMNMSIIVEINHDLDQEQKKQSEYTINQRQNDDGEVYNIHDIDISGVEQQQWFLEMIDVVKSKVRSQIFNTILESSKIEDGLIKLDN